MEMLFSVMENDEGSSSIDPRNEAVMESTKNDSKIGIGFTWEDLLNKRFLT